MTHETKERIGIALGFIGACIMVPVLVTALVIVTCLDYGDRFRNFLKRQ